MVNFECLKFGKKLGSGGYGEIVLAADDNNNKYAVKKISKAKSYLLDREIAAGRMLNNDSIVHFKGRHQDDSYEYLIFEFLPGYDLFTYFEAVRAFQRFSENEARLIITQLGNALNYCHEKGIVHLDVKLDNIMIYPDGRTVKLIDFGLCDFCTDKSDEITRRVGSEEYCAPEVISALYKKFSGRKIDTWCLGVVLYTLLTAQFPFDPIMRRCVLAAGGKHPTVTFPVELSEGCKDLISKMLEPEPERRITMKEVLRHTWMQQ